MKRMLAALAVVALFVGAQPKESDTRSLEGKAAPGITLKTTTDGSFDLAGEKGKVVLLDFWATWCPPCRESLPHLQKIHDDTALKEKGLKVVAVNAGEDKETAKGYCDKNKLTFPVALDIEDAVGKSYLVHGIPTTVVVGRDQKVKKVFVGFGPGMEEQVRKAVEDALAAK